MDCRSSGQQLAYACAIVHRYIYLKVYIYGHARYGMGCGLVTNSRHPLADVDLYSPVTPEMIEFLAHLRVEYGTWRMVCEVVGCRTRQLRALRTGRACVSLRFWDRLCCATDHEDCVEYTYGGSDARLWFTAEDLVALGLWKPPLVLSGERRGLWRRS